MMTAGPGTGGVCVQNPWYLQYGEHGQGRGRRPAAAQAAMKRRTFDDTPPRFPFVGKIQCVALYKGALNLARKISGVTRVIRRKDG